MRISHEAIYQALFVQSRGALRRELTACLRTGRVLRTPRARTRGRGKTFISPEIMISQRPAEAADRAVPAEIISHAVWLYHVFSLSLRDVELILAERGVLVTHESIRPRPGDTWHLDEVFIRIRGVQH